MVKCYYCGEEAVRLRFVPPETGHGASHIWCQRCPLPTEAARANDEMLTSLFSGSESLCFDYFPDNYPPA